MAIRCPKATGFHTTAITYSKDKEELASKLGADIVVGNGKELKKYTGWADVILATSNSYKATSEALKGFTSGRRIDPHWYF
jgi:dehydrogenase